MVARVFLVVAILFMAACGIFPSGDGAHRLILKNHSLAGKIWDVNQGRFVNKSDLLTEVIKNEYILLGETHDNILHHQGQAWVIDGLKTNKKSSIVAFEMIDQAQSKFVIDKKYESADSLINGLNHVKTTWKYERNYKPVFESVLAAGYAIYPANLDRSAIVAIGRKGRDEVSPHIKPYLDKNTYTPEQEKALRKEIKMSHCGMDNPHMATAMMLTQRVKDAVMTDSLLRKVKVDTRVLIAGSGHVRNDRGVPMYLQRENIKAKILTIAWLEVAEELSSIEAYTEHWGIEQLPFDYVWFTARVDRPDPCESFRRHMEKKKAKAETS